MRVAYLLPGLQKPSGWRSHALAFLQHIATHVELHLFAAANEAGELASLFPMATISRLPSIQQAAPGSPRQWPALLSTWLAIRRIQPGEIDLVHSLEAYPCGLVGHWLARGWGCPHVITAHGTYAVIWRQNAIDRQLYSKVLHAASLICPVSIGTADLMRQHFGEALTGIRLEPILNGNAFAQRLPRQQALERQPDPLPTLLSVGEVKPRKGYHTSLAAFAAVQRKFPQARYLIAGPYKPGPYQQRLQQIIDKNQLSGVEFCGAVYDQALDALYRRAWLFWLTPEQHGLRFEGFGLVYLEAGAYGLPVIGARTGGVPDAIQQGKTGLLVEPGDHNAAAAAAIRLLEDQALAQQMGQENRNWAESLTWERTASSYYQAYLSL